MFKSPICLRRWVRTDWVPTLMRGRCVDRSECRAKTSWTLGGTERRSPVL